MSVVIPNLLAPEIQSLCLRERMWGASEHNCIPSILTGKRLPGKKKG